MSNSYMGPRDPGGAKRPVRNYSPEDQWQSIKDERQKDIELKILAEKIMKLDSIAPPPPNDDFEIGGAL